MPPVATLLSRESHERAVREGVSPCRDEKVLCRNGNDVRGCERKTRNGKGALKTRKASVDLRKVCKYCLGKDHY